jgi:hypothetical protein
MWQVLDVLVRLMCLGAFVFVGLWVWAIISSAPKTDGRSCVSCSGELSEYDLANCYKCLTSSFKGVK